MSLIYSRSPFFIQSTSGSTATVSLYVWNGNSADVPTSAQYTLTKAHNSSGKATFEVSELIRDYVDQSFNGDYITEAVWVYISMADGFGVSTSGKYLATDGYVDEDFVQYVAVNQDNTITSIGTSTSGDGAVSEVVLYNGMAGYECEITSSGRAYVLISATVASGAQYTVSAYVDTYEGSDVSNFLDITSGGDNSDRSSSTIKDGKIEHTFTSTSTSLSFRLGLGATSTLSGARKAVFGGLQIVAGSSSADSVKANLKSDEVLISNDYISVPEDTTAVIPTKDADMAVFYKDGEVKFISELADKNLFPNPNEVVSGGLATYTGGTASVTTTNNHGVAPDGTQKALRFQATIGSTSSDEVGLRDNLTMTSQTSTLSFYGKSNTSSDQTIAFHFNGGTKTVVTLTDEWQRFEYTDASSTSNNAGIQVRGTYTSTNVDVLLFGLQMEYGSHATEYNSNDSNSSGAINYATSAGQSASTFYARVMKDGGTIVDEKCSDDIMEYVSELDIDEAHVIKSDGKVEVISVETLPCNKYENVRLTFVNKFGALQDIHFSAKTTESMSSKGNSYNSINFDYDNLSNNYGSHSVRDFNKNATVRHTLNTDYLHESYSEVFRQLIVSEEVWMEHKGTVKPVNVTTNSLQKKTHANNGLVQLTISVKESHSLINNIR